MDPQYIELREAVVRAQHAFERHQIRPVSVETPRGTVSYRDGRFWFQDAVCFDLLSNPELFVHIAETIPALYEKALLERAQMADRLTSVISSLDNLLSTRVGG